MLEQLEELRLKALHGLEGVNNIKELEAWRVNYLGKKSKLTNSLRSLATLPLEERKIAGARANELKTSLEDSFR
ncbi:MAG: phenylalanine--tRNA ligase subunit alpha, partial [Chloroflexi bacterium]|nr:phenylalanine--tRNA ligase subunit alpha [Chloroflexota bacterium]